MEKNVFLETLVLDTFRNSSLVSDEEREDGGDLYHGTVKVNYWISDGLYLLDRFITDVLHVI